jgi:hypothetical protein
MKKQLRTLAFLAGIGLMPLCLSPLPAQAQQNQEDQRAYQTGYEHGVNDAQRNRPMNSNTDDWHGQRNTLYREGYEKGYSTVRGYGTHRDEHGYVAGGQYGNYANDPESQRAYQTGYQHGVRDAEQHRAMNMNTDDWHGERLQAYRQGYEHGYRNIGVRHGDHDDDDRH